MIITYATKVLNIFRFLIYQIIDLILKSSKQTKHSKTLLLIRLDAIGDYILIRNIFQRLKQSKKFKGFKITLCGNIVWKDLSETFDKDGIDDFIWLNRKNFNNNPFYKFRLLKKIYQSGFEVVVDTTFSREILFGDSIVKTSCADERIGSVGAPDAYVKWKRNLLTDKYYTRLFPYSTETIFEFYRNKEFFINILQEKLGTTRPEIKTSNVDLQLSTNKDFAVIFPGAQEEKRRWHYTNFEHIIEELINTYKLNVIIAGSSDDSVLSRKMVKCHTSKSCFDMTGKTTLPQLAKLISLSKILISNETSAVHFAAAVGTPFICISNGQRFGRFMPYPKELNITGRYFYPEDIEKNLKDLIYLEKYRFDSDLDINSISPIKIIKALPELL
jgi:ADP-heptose:LPS heptosyltransferase